MVNFRNLDIISGSVFQTKLYLKKDLQMFFETLKYSSIDISDVGNMNHMTVDHQLMNTYKKDLKEIHKCIDNALEELIKNIYMYDCNFKIAASWATKTSGTQASDIHNHSNSWLSGVYYPQGNNKITFYNMAGHFHTHPREYNMYNSRQYTLTTEKDTLLLFPSHVYHKIPPTQLNHTTRYSLAFNVLPYGLFGHRDSELSFQDVVPKKTKK